MLADFYHQQLSFPLLAVMGGEDYVFLKAATNYVASQQNAQLHVIPACGHICNIEKANEFNRIALEYYANWSTKLA